MLLKQPQRATFSQTPMYHHPEMKNLKFEIWKGTSFSFFTWLLPSQKSVRALKWENSNGLPSWADKYNHGDSVDWFLNRKVGSVEPFQWKHCRYLLLQALPTGFPEKLEPGVLEIKMLVEIVMDWDEICNEDIEQWSSIPCRFPSPKDFWSLTRPWQLQHPSFINE